MELTPLTALSPVDGRYHGRTPARLRELFSEYGLIRARLEVETAWLRALAAHPQIPEAPALAAPAQARLDALAADFSPAHAAEVKAIERDTNHDVKALEYWLRARLEAEPELAGLAGFTHFACTSWDVNHTAYALMLDRARAEVLLPALEAVAEQLRGMAHAHAALPMLARTHGQPASPTTLGKELAVTVARLERQLEPLAALRFRAKMNGAVGNYNAHRAAYPEVDWPAHERDVLAALGLEAAACTTQIEPYDQFAEFFHLLARIHTLLIDFARDVWQYISDGYFRQKARAAEVGSSTMPHKVNPIDFENAEGNLGLARAELVHYAEKLPISRLQRDLSDSTVLRNLGATLAGGANAYAALRAGLGKLEADGARLAADLAASPEVLAEAVQTVMKRYGLPEPYERLKAFTRGRAVTAELLAEFIAGLELPDDARARLAALTPADYTGYAEELARGV